MNKKMWVLLIVFASLRLIVRANECSGETPYYSASSKTCILACDPETQFEDTVPRVCYSAAKDCPNTLISSSGNKCVTECDVKNFEVVVS